MVLEPGFSPKEMEYMSHRVMIIILPRFLRPASRDREKFGLFLWGGGVWYLIFLTKKHSPFFRESLFTKQGNFRSISHHPPALSLILLVLHLSLPIWLSPFLLSILSVLVACLSIVSGPPCISPENSSISCRLPLCLNLFFPVSWPLLVFLFFAPLHLSDCMFLFSSVQALSGLECYTISASSSRLCLR